MNANDISTLVENEVRLEIFKPFIDKAVGGETVIEVGTFVGGNLCRVAQMIKDSNKDITLYGIDNFRFENVSKPEVDKNTTVNDTFYQQLLINIDSTNLNQYINIIDSDSIGAIDNFEDESIDLLFLDGNHVYPYVSHELKAWLPKVKRGGIISGHDWPVSGIQQGVKENLPNHKINIVNGNGAYWTIK